VATGYQALHANLTGGKNTAVGYQALLTNDSDGNVAVGMDSLTANTSGNNNVAIGTSALQTNIGGSFNVAIGYTAGNGQTDISNTINVGYNASCNASNTACIGNADISCVYFGSINGNAKLDCSGIVIGSQGITLPHANTTTSTVSSGGFNATASTNGLSGRIQLNSFSTLTGSSSGGITWTNTTLLDDSLVLLTLDSSKNSISAWDNCTVTMSNTPGGKGIIISNNSTTSWSIAPGEAYYINYLIINPT